MDRARGEIRGSCKRSENSHEIGLVNRQLARIGRGLNKQFLPILLGGSFASGRDTESPSVMPNPKGSQWLRTMERETDQESEEVAEGEAEKMSQNGKQKRRGLSGGSSLDIDTYPAIKLMNLIRLD